jgi:hypothetical protein
MDFIDFIFIFFGFTFITSKFEIKPIKAKVCDLHIIDKESNYDNIKYKGINEDLNDRIIKMNLINTSFSEINFFGKLYKIKLYENTTHIISHICEEIE